MKTKVLSIMALGSLILTGAGCFSTTAPTPTDESDIDLSDFTQDLTGVSIEVMTPEAVSVGEEFTFGVKVMNSGDERRSLRSIDIDRPALSGIEVTGISPSTEREYYVESLDQDIFEFNAPISANNSLTVEFTATAERAGAYVGDFDVCIDNDINCVFDNIALEIN